MGWLVAVLKALPGGEILAVRVAGFGEILAVCCEGWEGRLVELEPLLVNLQGLDPRLARRRRHPNLGSGPGSARDPAFARDQGLTSMRSGQPARQSGKASLEDRPCPPVGLAF